MAASRNEATGDVLANVKGSADKYAEGWDYIENSSKEWTHDWNNPRLLSTEAEVEEVNSIPLPAAVRVKWKLGDHCPWSKTR